mgnify:CR=1 FL=1|tara:strand:- start:542 stop:712 length:171 start_codon:yes stop_codon:yes gene_type:complete
MATTRNELMNSLASIFPGGAFVAAVSVTSQKNFEVVFLSDVCLIIAACKKPMPFNS